MLDRTQRIRARHPRVAARWLLRYLEEDDDATIDELAFAASCLAARTGNSYLDGPCTPGHDREGD